MKTLNVLFRTALGKRDNVEFKRAMNVWFQRVGEMERAELVKRLSAVNPKAAHLFDDVPPIGKLYDDVD